MPTTRSMIVTILAAGLFAVAPGPASPTAERGGRETDEPSRGAVLYRLHCASCHGAEGRGDGPVAADLKSAPPDLTRIAARRGGRFSADEVARLVDGRTAVAPHGTAAMPVWGLSLRQGGRLEDQDEETWLQIRELVRHLRSLQKGPVVEDG